MEYKAKSLEDIAQAFEHRADCEMARYGSVKTKHAKWQIRAVAETWKEAARMVRQTKMES